MDWIYPISVFAHVAGAVLLGVAGGIEAVALARLRRAVTVDEARTWLGQLALPGRLGQLAMLAILASGIWMTVSVWGHAPWIASGFAGMVLMGALGGAVTGRWLKRVGPAVRQERGPELTPELRARLASPVLDASLRLRAALGVGVLALMAMKPTGGPAATVLLAASAALGLAWAAGPLAAARGKGAQAGGA
ncbi:conserved hypothetical protein [Anaeromyxobacter dehalogenans 2CP-1]|uniref:DUF2269 family protein n=1 Tax=Anaeromyxobacter dehalogenans (strain ATCC BAA-258 / DSM 21875 / 2CP-1) TaxID=455488 RepID=B8J5V7_ANAD2|nr:hypothetical protein [Anaeromyxobacter dehalogenans]ACL65054.1 conserved hypothetical protein [Anaeromyxobacter dehalogenans 2CP-1]